MIIFYVLILRALKSNPLPHLSATSIFNFSTLGPSPETIKKRWGRGGVRILTKTDFRFNAPKNQNGMRAMGELTSSLLNQLTAGF